MAPHHRRRRAVALLSMGGVAVAAIAAGLLLFGGETPVSHDAGAGSSAGTRALAGLRSLSPAAHEALAENAAIDRTMAYTPYVRIAGAQHREIALTFDDGQARTRRRSSRSSSTGT